MGFFFLRSKIPFQFAPDFTSLQPIFLWLCFLARKEREKTSNRWSKEKKWAAVPIPPWFSLYLSYAWKYQPWNFSSSSYEDLYNFWQHEKLFSVNHLLNFVLNVFFTDQYWDEKGPIFFYTGNEGPITGFWENSGFVFEAAQKFNALVIFGEHVSTQGYFVWMLNVWCSDFQL